MAGSTTDTLNDLLPQIVAEAQYQAEERSIMRGLVKNFVIPPGNGKTLLVPVWEKQTAATWTEGDEISNTAVSTTGTTLTVVPIALRTLATDFAVQSAATNVVADLGKLFGEAIARKIDTDLTAKFASFTTNVVGSSTSTITAADVFKAVTLLRRQGVASDQIACVLHPDIAYDLKAALTTSGNTPYVANAMGDVANEAMRMGYVGMLAGVPVYETSNMANTGTAGDYKGGVFMRDSLALAMMKDISIEAQRRASYAGTDIVATAYYATGVIQEAYGVQMLFDSSIV
jgi:N4-gp56 family major capsid protein